MNFSRVILFMGTTSLTILLDWCFLILISKKLLNNIIECEFEIIEKCVGLYSVTRNHCRISHNLLK